MASCKVLIADGLAPEGISRLKDIPGIELIEHKDIPRDDLKKVLGGVDILIVRSRTQVDKDLLASATNLKLAIRAGIGLDNIDVAAATDRGVVVMNAPTGNIVTTAEHALALLFSISRRIPEADATLRQGKWEKKKFQGSELRNKVVGVLGLGNIGKAFAERALGLKMKVLGFDPYLSAEAAAKYGVELLPLDQVLAKSDYITVHVPLIPATKGLLNRDTIKKMKKGAYLINCARGGIVDESALIEALESGHLTGAALDVFEVEPLPADSPLLKRRDIVLTPHLGASTDEAQVQVGLEVAEQVGAYLRDGVYKNAVNVPNISVEQLGVMKPWIDLCEKLGAFIGQLAPSQTLKKVRIRYEGTIQAYDRKEVLTLAVMKGLFTALMNTPVNLVNARKFAKDRGLQIEESMQQECADFAGLIEITLEGDQKVTCSGTLYGKQEPRLVRVDQFAIDAVPSGCLLYTKNVDQPGVIGAMGTLLATHGVNIAAMHLGRDHANGQAIALINIDSEPPAKAIESLRQTKGMLTVRSMKL